MKKTYAAKRLLEHGPLTFAQFCEITGWSVNSSAIALRGLLKTGIACIRNDGRRRIYDLA